MAIFFSLKITHFYDFAITHLYSLLFTMAVSNSDSDNSQTVLLLNVHSMLFSQLLRRLPYIHLVGDTVS